jgi:hypothetical protein
MCIMCLVGRQEMSDDREKKAVEHRNTFITHLFGLAAHFGELVQIEHD